MVATRDKWEITSTLPREASYEQRLKFFGFSPYAADALDANIARKRRRWNHMSNTGSPSGRAKVAEVLALIQRTSQVIKRGAMDNEGGGALADIPAPVFDTLGELWHILTEYVFAHEYDDALRVAREAVGRWHNADAASALAWAVSSMVNDDGFAHPQRISEGLTAARFAVREQPSEVRNWESLASLLLGSGRAQEALVAMDDAEHATDGQATAMLYLLRAKAMAALQRPDETMVAAVRAVSRAAPAVVLAVRSELTDVLISWAATMLPIKSSAALARYTEMVGVAAWCSYGVPEAEDRVRPYQMWAINAGKRVFIGSTLMRSFLAVITGFISVPIHNYLRSKPGWQVFIEGIDKPLSDPFFIVAAPNYVQKINNVNLGFSFQGESTAGMAEDTEELQPGGTGDTLVRSRVTVSAESPVAINPLPTVMRRPRPLATAFTDGLGDVFDLFGAARQTQPAPPAFEDTLEDDAYALCLALGLLPGSSTGHEGGYLDE